MVLQIIEESELPKTLIARDSGLSRHTLHSWIVERTAPTRESSRQLAEGLRKRAAKLQDLAEELEKAAREEG